MTFEPSEAVGGIILAAVTSNRFGSDNKLLAVINETPIITQAAKTLVDSHLTDVVVIVGHQEGAIRDALASLPLSFRRNKRYQVGQSTSVATGSAVARENGWDGALFALGDMPFVQTATVNRLLSAYASRDGTVVAPVYDDIRGSQYSSIRSITTRSVLSREMWAGDSSLRKLKTERC